MSWVEVYDGLLAARAVSATREAGELAGGVHLRVGTEADCGVIEICDLLFADVGGLEPSVHRGGPGMDHHDEGEPGGKKLVECGVFPPLARVKLDYGIDPGAGVRPRVGGRPAILRLAKKAGHWARVDKLESFRFPESVERPGLEVGGRPSDAHEVLGPVEQGQRLGGGDVWDLLSKAGSHHGIQTERL